MHSHSNFCGHASGDLVEYVKAADAANLSCIACTEHYPISEKFDPIREVGMPRERMTEYFKAIQDARDMFPQIEILTGCELDWCGEQEDRSFAQNEFDGFEIILGSVHYVDMWPFDDPAQKDHWHEVGVDAVWERYFEVWCQAATDVGAHAPYFIMAHPDLVKKFGFRPSYDPINLYKSAAEALASTSRMIEVNTSGAYYPCKEMFPAPALLEQFCRAGIPCTVGTDAHDPANMARGIKDAYKLMYNAGYRELTIPTRDGDRRTIAL